MSQSPDTALIIQFANRFEAIATDGFEGQDIEHSRNALIHELTHRGTLEAGLLPAVAHAVGLLAGFIEDSDPGRRFEHKIAILRDMAERLQNAVSARH